MILRMSVELTEIVANIVAVLFAEVVVITSDWRVDVILHNRVMPPAVVDDIRIFMGGTEHMTYFVSRRQVGIDRSHRALTSIGSDSRDAAVHPVTSE